MRPFQTFGEILQYVEANYDNPRAFNYIEDGAWKHVSTENFIFDIKRIAYGLISLGLKPEDNVGILALSVPRWNIADFAIVMAGGVTVPLFPKMSEEGFVYQVAQANIRFLFVQGERQWKTYRRHPNLFEHVIGLDESSEVPEALKYHELLQRGEALWHEKPGLWDELMRKQRGDDVATIIYTAGTMGVPKGAELTHRGLCHLPYTQPFGEIEKDRYLNILPLAHIFARQICLVLIAWGAEIYYLNDVGAFARACRVVKPTMTGVVPRVLEKMYDRIVGALSKEKNKFRRWIGLWAIKLAKEPGDNWIKKGILRPIANLLVYDKIRRTLGGHWRGIISGGAALDPDLCRFFHRVGIPIYEGWGLTEGSISTTNSPGDIKIGTVGRPILGVKVVISKDKEVLVGGPTVMKGYYRNPAATEEALDAEGWLRTGDKGALDKDGYLSLIGRIKEQFKLSSGEYVAPSRIEQLLGHHPLIEMSMVIGDKQRYPCCLLFPDKRELKKAKQEQNAEALSNEEFLDSPYVKAEMKTLIEDVNGTINAWERLYRYRFILETPTVEIGVLTPTLKLKRRVVLERYRDLIDTMYKEETT